MPVIPLRVRGLRKRYGSVEVLRGVDLEVGAGQVYGFLGRNGAGKSTALRTVMGIQTADEGTLELFGELVARPTVRHKQRIGYVSQEQHVYPWMSARTLADFVCGLYPSWDATEYERLLDRFELPPTRRVVDLSGGMKVKLALAMALAYRPPLLLLDEPTSGLDPAARREFLDLVGTEARGQGRATLFSSHIVEEVERVADVVGVLVRGRVAYEGPVGPLRARHATLEDAFLALSRP